MISPAVDESSHANRRDHLTSQGNGDDLLVGDQWAVRSWSWLVDIFGTWDKSALTDWYEPIHIGISRVGKKSKMEVKCQFLLIQSRANYQTCD